MGLDWQGMTDSRQAAGASAAISAHRLCRIKPTHISFEIEMRARKKKRRPVARGGVARSDGFVQSTVAPLCFTTFDQRACSAATNLPKFAGVSPT